MKKITKIVCVIVVWSCILTGLYSQEVYADVTKKIIAFGIKDEDGADRYKYIEKCENDGVFEDLQNLYNLNDLIPYKNYSAGGALSLMRTYAGIFVIHSHGNPDCVKFTSANGTETYLYRSDIESLPNAALSDANIIIYGTCSAGAGGSTAKNIVNSTYKKGATIVIGFQDITYVSQMNQWLYEFLKSKGKGNNADQAIEDAIFWTKFWNFGNAGGTDNYLIRQGVYK